jgi:uncharacterized RDD family membrane protein YckC
MRCPKCHYISFGSVDRCRNCGYEFSLTPEVEPFELPIQDDGAPLGPMSDLELRPSVSGATVESDGRASARESPAGVQRAAAASRLDLPLFSDRAPSDDAPLITAPRAPRQPLSVRRAQPGLPKPRPEPTLADLAGEEEHVQVDRDDDSAVVTDVSASRLREQLLQRRVASDPPPAPARQPADVEVTAAPVLGRLVAGAIDVAILAGIDAAILYFTLQVLELPVNELRSLPPVPLAVFLLLLNGGYLAIFTAAGGQTIGKMLTGIRVVATPPDDDEGFDRFTPRVSLGAAVLRAAAYLASLLPAGLGFAAILFDSERRALHDRLAETRVIKA